MRGRPAERIAASDAEAGAFPSEIEILHGYAELLAEQATSRRRRGAEITARLAACDAERAQLELRLARQDATEADE
jgi:hypothetical protein